MFEILVLSVVQGISEFLPVSSSSHLIIFGHYLNFEFSNLILDISLHAGSFLAVVFYFRKELLNFVRNKKLFILICISSIPVMIFGFLLIKLGIADNLRGIEIIGWTTIIFGIILYLSDRTKQNIRKIKKLDLKSAIIIGLFHLLSVVPGVSRSGIAITGSRFLGFSRVDSAKISFLLSIPTLLAVSLFGFYNIYKLDNFEFSQLSIISITLSFIFSYLTIKYFLIFIKNFSLNFFVIYRLILGSVILFYVY
tara:strand:- start:465 stop:1220 length:756 start_codon:yes stop_codon:yes gene_type:complete